jgi:hypothetical protein
MLLQTKYLSHISYVESNIDPLHFVPHTNLNTHTTPLSTRASSYCTSKCFLQPKLMKLTQSLWSNHFSQKSILKKLKQNYIHISIKHQIVQQCLWHQLILLSVVSWSETVILQRLNSFLCIQLQNYFLAVQHPLLVETKKQKHPTLLVVCMCVYIYIYTHTHTHTHTYLLCQDVILWVLTEEHGYVYCNITVPTMNMLTFDVWNLHLTKQVGIVVMFWTCIQEVHDANLGQLTSYPDWGFPLVFLSFSRRMLVWDNTFK